MRSGSSRLGVRGPPFAAAPPAALLPAPGLAAPSQEAAVGEGAFSDPSNISFLDTREDVATTAAAAAAAATTATAAAGVVPADAGAAASDKGAGEAALEAPPSVDNAFGAARGDEMADEGSLDSPEADELVEHDEDEAADTDDEVDVELDPAALLLHGTDTSPELFLQSSLALSPLLLLPASSTDSDTGVGLSSDCTLLAWRSDADDPLRVSGLLSSALISLIPRFLLVSPLSARGGSADGMAPLLLLLLGLALLSESRLC